MPETMDAAVVQPTVPDAINANAVINSLLLRLNQMEQQLQDKKDKKEPVDLGPPPPARKDRPHIMLMVKPDTMIRMEVTQEYIDQKLPGWDGIPVKGYLNHENTIRTR